MKKCINEEGIRNIQYDTILNFIKNNYKYKNKNLLKYKLKKYQIFDALAGYLGCFMDVYLMSRVFRTLN